MVDPAPRRRRPAAGGEGGGAAEAALVLLALAALYGAMSLVAYRVIHMRHVAPLGADAPLGDFSEGRVLHHLRRLSVDIPGRQEGSPGLEAAARYIKGQLEELAARAGPEYRIEVEESLVSGSFSMRFLRHRVTLTYRNHKNIVMRISSNVSEDQDLAFLVNGHFDSPLGSPGAADCGSCVASMLELSRLIIDSGWVPSQPVIFLFNGAEELFLLGSHGFIKTHKWNNTIGAFINIEASGSGGAEMVAGLPFLLVNPNGIDGEAWRRRDQRLAADGGGVDRLHGEEGLPGVFSFWEMMAGLPCARGAEGEDGADWGRTGRRQRAAGGSQRRWRERELAGRRLGYGKNLGKR